MEPTITQKAIELLNELPVKWEVLVRQYQTKELISAVIDFSTFVPCLLYVLWIKRRWNKLTESFTQGDLIPKHIIMILVGAIAFILGMAGLINGLTSLQNVLTPDVSFIQSIFTSSK